MLTTEPRCHPHLVYPIEPIKARFPAARPAIDNLRQRFAVSQPSGMCIYFPAGIKARDSLLSKPLLPPDWAWRVLVLQPEMAMILPRHHGPSMHTPHFSPVDGIGPIARYRLRPSPTLKSMPHPGQATTAMTRPQPPLLEPLGTRCNRWTAAVQPTDPDMNCQPVGWWFAAGSARFVPSAISSAL